MIRPGYLPYRLMPVRGKVFAINNATVHIMSQSGIRSNAFHPECTSDVVAAADYNGSTEFIIETITNAEPGSSWAVGTEINLVNRLSQDNPDKKIYCLDSVVCPCATMYRIHPAYLLWVLEGIMAGLAINRIRVSDQDRRFARVAVDRMLNVSH